jgi:hypothetical protein
VTTNHTKPQTVAQAFDAFHDGLKLDPDERQRAVDMHNDIANILSAQDYVDSHFLQGSLARKTMVKPLRDIDMVVTLAPEFAAKYTGELIQKKALREAASSTQGPTAAMEVLQAALEPRFPHATFSIGKHALTIDFGDDGFKFDVVPAIDEGDDVFIANTHTGNWERSNTRQLIRTVRERSQECNGRMVHEVRMIKHAVKQSPVGYGFFGLLSESITFHSVTASMPHAEACDAAFAVGADLLAGDELLDPPGEDNLLRKLDAATRRTAQATFANWRDAAREALDLEAAGDHRAAIAMWHGIFGDVFPESTQTVNEAARAWIGGAPTSSGHVTSRTRRETARPARSWRPTS